MQFKIEKNDDFVSVQILENRLDAANAPELRTKVSDLISGGSQRIVLDISNVEFMDSSSLGAMVSILKMVGGSGELIIAGANGIVLDLFKLTRMDKVFRMSSDAASAIDMMAAV